VARRLGDVASCYAVVSKEEQELNWTAERDIKDMFLDAWHFEKNYEAVVSQW